MTPVTPVSLRCAHLDNSLGIAPDRVRFSWQLAGGGLQQAYQLQVIQNGRVFHPASRAPAVSARLAG